MIAVRNWFPNGCASPNGCDDPACSLCNTASSARVADPADLKLQANAARDGAPKLAGEKERGNLAFQKRRRQGPHRGNT